YRVQRTRYALPVSYRERVRSSCFSVQHRSLPVEKTLHSKEDSMAKRVEPKGRGTANRAPVKAARRSGPGRGFWLAVASVAVLGIGALSWVATRPKNVSADAIDPSLP